MPSRRASRPLTSLASELNEHQPQQQLQQHRKDIAAAKTTTTGNEQRAARLDHGSGTRHHPWGIYQDHTLPGSVQEEPTLTHIMFQSSWLSPALSHKAAAAAASSSSYNSSNERYSWANRDSPTSISQKTTSILRTETGVLLVWSLHNVTVSCRFGLLAYCIIIRTTTSSDT